MIKLTESEIQIKTECFFIICIKVNLFIVSGFVFWQVEKHKIITLHQLELKYDLFHLNGDTTHEITCV